jgi:hypothetical protein
LRVTVIGQQPAGIWDTYQSPRSPRTVIIPLKRPQSGSF